MTEAEWLSCRFPDAMYNAIRNHVTTRQLRLYMVACCRIKADEFFDPRLSVAVDASERCAEDPTLESLLDAVWDELVTQRITQDMRGIGAGLGAAITDVWRLLDEVWDQPCEQIPYANERQAIAHAAYMSLRDKPHDVFTGGAGDAAEYCAQAIARAELLRLGIDSGGDENEVWKAESGTRKAIAHLLHDIFGNPFRSVAFDPEWRTATTTGLAAAMYEARSFDNMPILADALEEAGCDHPDVLAHCRDEAATHVRGCWVVDLVLGKA